MSKFISRIGHSLVKRSKVILQASFAISALLLAFYPLINNSILSLWFIPMLGVAFFVVSLTAFENVDTRLVSLLNRHKKRHELEDENYVAPVMVTKFAKQKQAN